MKFCEILKELREEQQITRKELAIRSGLSPQCISALEKEQRLPTSSTLAALSDYFKVSSDFLLGRTDDLGTPLPSLSGDDYTEEERDLVSAYRELDPSLQKLLWNMIEAWQKNTASNSVKQKNK